MAKKGGKQSSQKGGIDSKRWIKLLLPLLLVFIMLASALVYLFTPRDTSNLTGSNSGTTSSDVIQFNSIIDGLLMSPPGAEYVRYVDLKDNPTIGLWCAYNLNATIPDSKIFGAQPQKDLLVNYPAGYFGQDFTEQWASVTDFGPDYVNTYYNQTTYAGVPMRAINPVYTYTETRPTVSGRIQNVAAMITFMTGSYNQSALDNYGDLLIQLKGYPVNSSNAQLSVVGTTSKMNSSDRYYAGLTPNADGNFTYQAVLHFNKTLTDDQKQTLKSDYERRAIFAGQNFTFKDKAYNIQFQGDYLILQATADFNTCVYDMTENWGFLRA